MPRISKSDRIELWLDRLQKNQTGTHDFLTTAAVLLGFWAANLIPRLLTNEILSQLLVSWRC